MSGIGVLGLGAMGSRLAVNYANAGHHVTVWNRTPGVADDLAAAHDAITATSIRRAVGDADVVVSMVSDDAAAIAVWLGNDGALASMRPGSIAIESSTLTPDVVRDLAEAASAVEVRFVEAPVVGSRPQADAGALFYLLGGDPDAIEGAMPIIDINAGSSTRVGDAGTAALMKLAINGVFAAQVAAFAEIVGFVERSALDTVAAIATLAELPITSPGMQRILGLIENRAFEPNFPIHLVAKDLGYLTETSHRLGADVPVIRAASTVFADGVDGGLAELDIAGIARRYEP